MKKQNLQWLIMLLLLISSSLFAQNIVVSGAGTASANGTYIASGSYSGKPLYIKDGDTNWEIKWVSGSMWAIIEMDEMEYYYSYEDVAKPDLVTSWNRMFGSNPVPTVTAAGRGLAYSSKRFIEHSSNDGSIANSLIISYNEYGGDVLTGAITDNFVTEAKVIVTNVPEGLTAQIIKTGANQLTFSLTGNAVDHGQDTRILDITVVFQNSAFDQGNASNVSNFSISDIELLYLTTFSGGSGTVGEPFLISNKLDLKRLSENWSGDQWSKHFKQTDDIAFASSDFEVGGAFYNGGGCWIPIGNYNSRFTGTYDGIGYKISGLKINREESDYIGFFGCVGDGGIVKNLGVEIGDDGIIGQSFVGGFVGYNLGRIEKCYSKGNVSNVLGSGNNWFVGGFVGFNESFGEGTIEECYAIANVTGTSRYVGGFAGNNDKIIRKSYAVGNVIGNNEGPVGGFVGVNSNSGQISDCFARVEVSAIDVSITSIGGFSGANSTGKLNYSYSTGSVEISSIIQTNKGFCGYVNLGGNYQMIGNFWDTQTSGASTTAGNATGKTTAEMKTQSTFTDLGWNFVDTWKSDVNINDGYPYLSWQNPSCTFTDGSSFSQAPTLGSTNQAIGRFHLVGNSSGASLTSVSIKLNGTRSNISNFKLWYSTDASFNSETDVQIGATVLTDPGDGNSVSFSSFSRSISTVGGYYFLTCDLAPNATGDVIGVIVNANSLTISPGVLTGSIDNAVLSGTPSPLPVELSSFTASVSEGQVSLNWQTSTEVNNYGFEIQRTQKLEDRSENWEKIAFINGNGNSNSPNTYSFTDESLSFGKYSYRLKQIDNDGKYSYSSEVEVEIENIPTDYVLFQNYPNPFNPSTTIKFGLPKDSKVVLEVYNIIGERVATLINQEMSAGYHNINFKGNELSTGIYIYRITANEFTSTKKFILMK